MKKLLLLLLLSGCGYRLAAQVVIEPSEEGSALTIGKPEVSQSINPQPKEVARESTTTSERSLFAPGRSPF